MDRKDPTVDIEDLVKDMTPQHILRIKNRIIAQASKWLYGIDRPIESSVESIFILIPYTDKISGTKKLGQAQVMFRGPTGIGKTDLVQSVTLSINAISRRIQGNPEMMPRHIIGGSKIVESVNRERRIVFEPGPLLSHMVLVDEANRMRQQTFASVIEAMEERSLTPQNEYIDKRDIIVHTLPLFPINGDYTDFESPRFFQIWLTENPFGDEEGTYPNPQALLDRITLTIPIERPSPEDEEKINADNVVGKSIKPVTNLAEILACAHYIYESVKSSPHANNYRVVLLRNTNPKVVEGKPELVNFVKEYIEVGASPRVNFAMEAAARVHAFFSGSNIIIPEHFKAIASDVISHRLRLARGKEFRHSKEEIFKEILRLTEIPEWK